MKPYQLDAYYHMESVDEMQDKDAAIASAVGFSSESSGCGVHPDNFGNRDMQFGFDSLAAAAEARKRVEDLGWARATVRER